MEEADFQDAELSSVVFEDSRLANANLSVAKLARSELRGCD